MTAGGEVGDEGLVAVSRRSAGERDGKDGGIGGKTYSSSAWREVRRLLMVGGRAATASSPSASIWLRCSGFRLVEGGRDCAWVFVSRSAVLQLPDWKPRMKWMTGLKGGLTSSSNGIN